MQVCIEHNNSTIWQEQILFITLALCWSSKISSLFVWYIYSPRFTQAVLYYPCRGCILKELLALPCTAQPLTGDSSAVLHLLLWHHILRSQLLSVSSLAETELHCTAHVDLTLHTANCKLELTLHNAHCTLHNSRYNLKTRHYTLLTELCKIHTAYCAWQKTADTQLHCTAHV